MAPPYTTKDLKAATWNENDGGCPQLCALGICTKKINESGHCPGGREIYRTGGGCGSGSTRCVTTNDPPTADRCPSNVLGGVGSARWTGTQYYDNGINKAVGIVCEHTALPPDSKLFSDNEISLYFNNTGTVNPVSQMRDDRCSQYNFTALKADTSTCKPHYISKGSYDLELFKRIVSEGPTWITNTAKREHVMTCIVGSSVSLANDAANLFLDRINGVNGNSYAGIAVSNMTADLKDTWGQYSEIVGFMNQLLRTSTEAAGTVVPASIQAIVIATIRAYCASHSDQSACGCVNATKVPSSGVDPLTRCGTTDSALPGCADIKDLNDKFASITSPNLAPFVAGIKRAFIPRCYSSMCTAADTAGNQTVLRPDVYQPAACAADLNVCISSISAGRDINADVNVQQSCAGATGQSLPSTLSSVSSRSGETVTAGGAGSPATTSGPSRQGCAGGLCTQDGVMFQESDLIIKPGANTFVDKYLPTPGKQKAALGGFICCILVCCFIIMMIIISGGEEGGSTAPPPNYSGNIAKLRALASSL